MSRLLNVRQDLTESQFRYFASILKEKRDKDPALFIKAVYNNESLDVSIVQLLMVTFPNDMLENQINDVATHDFGLFGCLPQWIHKVSTHSWWEIWLCGLAHHSPAS